MFVKTAILKIFQNGLCSQDAETGSVNYLALNIYYSASEKFYSNNSRTITSMQKLHILQQMYQISLLLMSFFLK